MKIGVCADISKIEDVKNAGYDYIELPLNKLGTISEEEFQNTLNLIKKYGVPAESCSLLLPKTMQIIGDSYDQKALDDYLETAFSRMKALGATVVSFGSGKSRFIPEGWNHKAAFASLVEVTKRIVKAAEKYDVVIAIESLNRGETNLINSLREASALAAFSGASILVDSFHMRKENEPLEDIKVVAPIVHAHIAMLEKRWFPLEKNEEVMEFVEALKGIGYNERLSIEGKCDDFLKDSIRALAVLRSAFQED